MSIDVSQNGRLSIGGHQIAYTHLGNGPKIALIHGIPTSRHLWRKIIPALVSAGREVIALDLLGYGESDKPLVADLGIQGQSDIVVQALLALGWARGTLVGHDIGGGIVQLIAVDHPEIIERLILVDSIVYDSFPEPGIARLKDPVWDGILEAPDFDLKKGLAKGFARGMVHPDKITSELIEAYERPFRGVEGGVPIYGWHAGCGRRIFRRGWMPSRDWRPPHSLSGATMMCSSRKRLANVWPGQWQMASSKS